ncbi:MAG TPA: SRPBCC domain-containing protein, partial [Acidimicrobiales bacterium]
SDRDERPANTMSDNDVPREAVVIERCFDAPIDLIWQMWTDPEHFKGWYGPNGATIPVAKMDVRVGGTRLVCMEVDTPEGPRRMWFSGEYLEVVKNERLVYTESMSDEDGNVSPSAMGMPEGHPMTTEVRVELEDLGGRTKMVMTHAGIPAESPGATGWTMAFEKLTAHVQAHTER